MGHQFNNSGSIYSNRDSIGNLTEMKTGVMSRRLGSNNSQRNLHQSGKKSILNKDLVPGNGHIFNAVNKLQNGNI